MAHVQKPEGQSDSLPSQGAPSGPDAAADLVRLEMRLEESERRLKARSAELETEVRGKERLRSRIQELTKRIAELEETASALHREAVCSTALSRELDETLRVASEARRHLGAGLETERLRRETAEKELGEIRASLAESRTRVSEVESQLASERAAAAQALESESKRRDGEMREVRRQIQVARQKIEGHETHIDSLRAELAETRELRISAEKSSASFESRLIAAEKDLTASRSALESLRGLESEHEALKNALREADEKARAAMDNAEVIRREGVEAFEKAREAELSFQLREEELRRASESLAALKLEIKARAEREFAEMRSALEAERERMILDLDAERGSAAAALRSQPPPPEERLERLRAESEQKRRDISREAQDYLSAAPSRERWQSADEIRLALWAAVGAVLVVAVAAAVVLLG